MDFPRPSTCLTFPVHKHCPPPPSSTLLSLSPSSRWGLFLTERSFSLCLQQAPSLSPSSHTRLAVAVWSHIFLAWCLTQTPAHRRHSIHTCRITARCSRWSSLICRSCWFSLWAASYEILTCSFVFVWPKSNLFSQSWIPFYSQAFHFPFLQVFSSFIYFQVPGPILSDAFSDTLRGNSATEQVSGHRLPFHPPSSIPLELR